MRTILPKYALCPLKHNSCPPQNDPLKRKMITLFLGLMCNPIVDTIRTFFYGDWIFAFVLFRTFTLAEILYDDEILVVILFYTYYGGMKL